MFVCVDLTCVVRTVSRVPRSCSFPKLIPPVCEILCACVLVCVSVSVSVYSLLCDHSKIVFEFVSECICVSTFLCTWVSL